jgi:hypothetical protein
MRPAPTAAAARKILEHGGGLRFYGLEHLPALTIRELLAAPSKSAAHTFLRLAVPLDGSDAAVVKRWGVAFAALLDLGLTYPWGSTKRKARFRALAKRPAMLAALQGAVANSSKVPLDYLAVLVADGGAASYDALIPHLDAALIGGDARADRLTELRVHARKTPVLNAMFAELDGVLEARRATSPALALGPVIGVGALPELWFDIGLSSRELTHGVPRIQSHLSIDSRAATWFRVNVAAVHYLDDGHSSFTATTDQRDDLGIGRCAPAELPAWLPGVARKLRIRWDEPLVSSNLRGAKRDRIAAWLRRS